MSAQDLTESDPKPKTAAERTEAKRLAQLLCYKLMGFAPLVNRDDRVRSKMWADMEFLLIALPYERTIQGDTQGNEEKTNERSRLSNAVRNLSSAISQGIKPSEPGVSPQSLMSLGLEQCEQFFYVVSLYHIDVHNRLVGILDLAKDLSPPSTARLAQVPPPSSSSAAATPSSAAKATAAKVTAAKSPANKTSTVKRR